MSIKDELGVTETQYTELKTKLDEAEKSDKPYVVVDNNENIKVMGNPNNTKTNPYDFTATFRFPKRLAEKEEIQGEEKGGNVYVTKTYKDVIIDAQSTDGIIGSLATILPYFYKPKEDGTLGEFNVKEAYVMMESMRHPDFTDAVRKIAQNALGLSNELTRSLDSVSALEIMGQIFENYPDVVNAAHDFFTSGGQQSAEASN